MYDKYFLELSKEYPTRRAITREIAGLSVCLNLPKGTEHFVSDIHGEYEALTHIRRGASGVIRHKIDLLFSTTMSEEERSTLASVIYYPEKKLRQLKTDGVVNDEWYRNLTLNLIFLCRLVCDKYTVKKCTDILNRCCGEHAELIDELIRTHHDGELMLQAREDILKSVFRLGEQEEFIISLCDAISELVIDRWHVVGDIFDRGPRADLVIDELMKMRSIDIEWGNHDVLWMGAAAGSRAAIATALANSLTYGNLEQIELGYGISLRPLAQFAEECYSGTNLDAFMPRTRTAGDNAYADAKVIARMHKAISILRFKLEGEIIMRNPDFDMEDRLLLDKIDFQRGRVRIGECEHEMLDCDLPTVDPRSPYTLTDKEEQLMEQLVHAFSSSERLCRHIAFLYEVGGMYKIYNRNLMFHGCIPLDESGEFLPLKCAEERRGRELMDYFDRMARVGYFAERGSDERRRAEDILWFLWCGKDSPLCARKRISSFERLFIADKSTHAEPKNHYYNIWNDSSIAEKILNEFSLAPPSHIINGHIPVKRGEHPIKSDGRLIVIDGGFCSAYKSTTGISGYTLIYNAEGMRLAAHEAFAGVEHAVKSNADIVSEVMIFEQKDRKIRVRETDEGIKIREKIADLLILNEKYRRGEIKGGI